MTAHFIYMAFFCPHNVTYKTPYAYIRQIYTPYLFTDLFFAATPLKRLRHPVIF
jgi:hypothetical protein